MAKKKQSQKEIRSLLQQSVDQSLPLRIRRSVEPEETVHGIVVGHAADWLLLAALGDGAYFDGYTAIRLADLRRVDPEPTFLPVLREDSAWPPSAPATLDLSGPRSILESGTAEESIVAVFRESKAPGKCLIGAPKDWGKKSVWLLTIDPEAEWEDFLIKLNFKDITQISFGGDYEKALLQVAGALPAGA